MNSLGWAPRFLVPICGALPVSLAPVAEREDARQVWGRSWLGHTHLEKQNSKIEFVQILLLKKCFLLLLAEFLNPLQGSWKRSCPTGLNIENKSDLQMPATKQNIYCWCSSCWWWWRTTAVRILRRLCTSCKPAASILWYLLIYYYNSICISIVHELETCERSSNKLKEHY